MPERSWSSSNFQLRQRKSLSPHWYEDKDKKAGMEQLLGMSVQNSFGNKGAMKEIVIRSLESKGAT
jgi:hypothetical protein